jgi:transposase-like protein
MVEADETYMSRKYRTDMSHLSPEEIKWRLAAKNTSSNKGMVLGIVARKGHVVVKVFDSTNGDKIKKHVKQVVAKNSFLFTDGANHYKEGLEEYKHDSVIHSKREYVRGDIHTNNIENFWGVMKRGIYGIYQQVSYKHLQAYCDEFAYRYNNRGIKDNERFELSLSKPEGRLTYQQLIHGKPKEETYTEEESEWE